MPSQKILEAKKQVVSSYVSDFREAVSFVFADARGLTVAEDTELRANLRKGNVKYKVIKNTTSRFVFKELQVEGLDEVLQGPTAIAYSTEDVIQPAKLLSDFSKKHEKLEIKSGILEGKVLSVSEVKELAKIPGRDVLYTQIAYGLNGPITKLAMLLDALRVKLEESGEIAPSSPAAEVPAAESDETQPTAADEAPAAPAESEAPAEATNPEVPAAETDEKTSGDVPEAAAQETDQTAE